MIQLGDLIFSYVPTNFSATPQKFGERKTRSIRGTLIKSGDPVVKQIFAFSGVTRADYLSLKTQFAYAGFLPFIPGELIPEEEGTEYIVSFNTLGHEKTGNESPTYTIELEEK